MVGIIKIYVNTLGVNKKYFLKTKKEKGGGPDYKMWKDPNQ